MRSLSILSISMSLPPCLHLSLLPSLHLPSISISPFVSLYHPQNIHSLSPVHLSIPPSSSSLSLSLSHSLIFSLSPSPSPPFSLSLALSLSPSPSLSHSHSLPPSTHMMENFHFMYSMLCVISKIFYILIFLLGNELWFSSTWC